MIASSIAKPFEALLTHLNEKQNALQKLAMQKELQEAEIKCKQKEVDTSCVSPFMQELYQTKIQF
jgi:hypothetical protein